jgi:dienelactone hydrolase
MPVVTRTALSSLMIMALASAAQAEPRTYRESDPTVSTVTLKAADGTQLKGTYFAADKPGPGLLLLHQCNRDRSAWTAFATAAAARGFHVFAMDYRGFGESEGPRFDNFQNQQATLRDKWPGDVDAAFTFLSTREGVDKNRIGAAGASCGVNQSAQLARRHPEVKAVVLLSGGIEPNAREYIRNTPSLAVLAAASLDDGNIVPTMRWITGWSSHPASKFIEYTAAGHGTDMFAPEPGLQPAMLDWFDAHLMKAATGAQAAAPKAKTVTDEFWTALAAPGGAAKARQIYDETRKDKTTILFPEGELNQFGYQVLQEGRAKDAIIIFKMNVDEYPKSANTYDSLSDAYLADGNKEEALRFAEKALEALATDTQAAAEFKQQVRESAEAKIKQLKKKDHE